jgi:hypothetical protein
MQHFYRRNSDEELRKLERLVMSGDAEALARYIHAYRRIGKDHPYISTLAADVGTDYSGHMGARDQINRDETGIRYGVISAHDMEDSFFDILEFVYARQCPYCDTEFDEGGIPEICPGCNEELDEDECYSEEPASQNINSEGVVGLLTSNNNVWITKSPYYIRGTYCSPCAPGAVSIGEPTTDGPIAYCPPHDWFREDLPRLIFRVDDNTIVYSD